MDIEKISKEHETSVISFLLKDIRHIDKILKHGKISSILKYFKNEDCKKLFEIINDYKVKYNELLVRGSLETILEKKCKAGDLDAGQRLRLLNLFDDAIDEGTKWKTEQFNQLISDWFQVEIVPFFVDTLRGVKTKLESFDTFDAFEIIEKEIAKYRSFTKTEEEIEAVHYNEEKEIKIKEFEENLTKKDSADAIPSGIVSLDVSLNGFKKKKLSLIGGRSSSGKTTLAVNIATNMARAGHKVLIVSLEMTKKEIFDMIDSRVGKIPYYKLENPHLMDKKTSDYAKQVFEKTSLDIFVLAANANSYTWNELEQIIEERVFASGFKPDIVFIDYLALISLPKSDERRDNLLGELTKQLRAYAGRHNMAVCSLVQANRASLKRDAKSGKMVTEILLENIEDSNKIGQDTDLFLTINQIKIEGDNSIKYEVWIRKQRGGKKDVMVTLSSQMMYQWINDDESIMREPFPLGIEPTEMDKKLNEEMISISKNEEKKLRTGIEDEELNLELKKNSEYGETKYSSLEDIVSSIEDEVEDKDISDDETGIDLYDED